MQIRRANLFVLPAPTRAKVFSSDLLSELGMGTALNRPHSVLFREGKNMSIRLCDAVWKRGPKNRAQRTVLLTIADYASHEGFAFPLVQSIARKCAYTERHVRRILSQLEAENWLMIKTNPKNYKAHIYEINIAKLSPDILSADHSKSPDILSADHRTFSAPYIDEPSYLTLKPKPITKLGPNPTLGMDKSVTRMTEEEAIELRKKLGLKVG